MRYGAVCIPYYVPLKSINWPRTLCSRWKLCALFVFALAATVASEIGDHVRADIEESPALQDGFEEEERGRTILSERVRGGG